VTDPTKQTGETVAALPSNRAESETIADRPPRRAPKPEEPRSSVSLTTAADAMRDEEVQRTRQFIALGWVVSLAAIGTVPFLDAPRTMSIAMIAALVWGMVMSFYFYRRFGEPRGYNAKRLLTLAILAIINAHVVILYYGVFTPAPVIIVLGIHFGARTEDERAARYMYATAVACYVAVASIVVAGVIDDPGVFATDRPLARSTLALGALFVLGLYTVAYYAARALRATSLSSIEALQRATRLASQRKALMDELRADLERALRVGGPGRHTDQIVGSFKLGMVLGRGAMGEVYEATHVTTGEPAAVKLLRRELLADPTYVARFVREAKTSGALVSPHVVRVLEVAETGVPFIAMERLHGETLAEILRRDGRVHPPAVVELCTQVGAGIDAAIGAGIVHRDLKPQNLFKHDSGWKILDFGVATLAEDTGTLTDGNIVGTPSYMAPEQAKGLRVDGRADLYALAAVVYRCLTGRHPFTGPDTPALLYAVVHRMPSRPSELAPLDADVDRWIAIALAKSPDDRFATGDELARTLGQALAGELDGKLRKRADALIRRRGWEAAA
jgi:serine/threonine-protein kinase